MSQVADSGLSYTLLHPSLFANNLFRYQESTMFTADPTWYGATKGGKVTFVSPIDVAAVAVKALNDPEKFSGKVLTLTGPEAITNEDFSSLVAAQWKMPVKYRDLADHAFKSLFSNSVTVRGEIANTFIKLRDAAPAPLLEILIGKQLLFYSKLK